MRNILFIIFAILIIGFGSNIEAFVPTDMIEGKQIFPIRNSEDLTEYRDSSFQIKERQHSKMTREKEFDGEDIQGQKNSDETILIITFLVFGTFFIIFNFDEIRQKIPG